MKFEDFKEVDPSSIAVPAQYKGRTNIEIFDKVEKAGSGKAYVFECKDLQDTLRKYNSLMGSLKHKQHKGKYLGMRLFRRANVIYLVNDADKKQL